VQQITHALACMTVYCTVLYFQYANSAYYFLLGCLSSRPLRRGLAHRAWAALRNASLRSSGPMLRQRAAPRPTACRFIGDGESFRLARSSISKARSRRTSGGSPVCRMIRRSVIVRLTPRYAASSDETCPLAEGLSFAVDMRMLVLVDQFKSDNTSAGGSRCPATS
jgi:hypothetical protein